MTVVSLPGSATSLTLAEPVELGHDESVAGPDGGQCLVQAGADAVGAGKTLVEVDPVVRDAERGQDLALGGEVLQDDGAPGVADEFVHLGSVSFSPPRLYRSKQRLL